MTGDLHTTRESELLPVRQRIAWMAAIWFVSVAAMVLATMAIHTILT